MARHYYAAQSPRGFANEIIVHRFNTRGARDAWVAEHADDGDVNAATRGAYAVTAKEAQAILADTGDDATKTFHLLQTEG